MSLADEKELLETMEWLREAAIEHIEMRGLATLQCSRKLFGVGLDIEVFYGPQSVSVWICFGPPERGVHTAIEDAEFEEDSADGRSLNEWGGLVAGAFYNKAWGLQKWGPFVRERDWVAVEAAAGSAGRSGGSKTL